MAVSLELPDLGAGPVGGRLAEWYVPDGTAVKAGEAVCRVESDFIACELEATQPGVLRHQLPAGANGPAGAPLGFILSAGEAAAPPRPAKPPAEERLTPSAPGPGPAAEPTTPAAFPALEDGEETGEPSGQLRTPAERVVLPFPRRFSKVPAMDWDAVPGDAVGFSTALLGEPDHTTDELPEPGGSIPGLPLWTADEDPAVADAFPIPVVQAPPPAPADETVVHVAPAFVSQVLTVTAELELTEATKMASALSRTAGLQACTEDVVFRAIALALDEAGRGGDGLLEVAEKHEDTSATIAAPAKRTLREAITARQAGGDAVLSDVRWSLVSLAGLGATSATPRLEPGFTAAFVLGACRTAGTANVTMAVDGGTWSTSEAARVLARVRDFVEAPYAMLA